MNFIRSKKVGLCLYYVVNSIYVLTTSAVGAWAGAVWLIFPVATILRVVDPPPYPGAPSARGDVIAFLLISIGFSLGTLVGAACSLRRPILKRLKELSG